MRLTTFSAAALLAVVAAACGPSTRETCDDVLSDPDNCGACGNACADGDTCQAGACVEGGCTPGDTRDCYGGPVGTNDVGACHGGTQTCDPAGDWGSCTGQQLPVGEDCANGIDDNCSGQADEDTDLDGDGFTTCGGDCCDSIECGDAPQLVNPNAFEDPANTIDDNCDGVIDEAYDFCDTGLQSDSSAAADFAKAIDICRTTTAGGPGWGLISAEFTLADGTGSPNQDSKTIRDAFGANMVPLGGARLIELSSGIAADTDDFDPSPGTFIGESMGTSSNFPADYLAANGGQLPNIAACPAPLGNTANDAVMLTMQIKVPSNARSFSISTNFLSAEYPEYVCTEYNDFFLVLLDSAYASEPPNPADKNLAIYTTPDDNVYPVGVNLAFGNTGLFRQCQNGVTGCSGGVQGNQTSCTASDQLIGTGFDEPQPGACADASVMGGGTGWLTTSGNVVPGETITLRIAIWDTSDNVFDSLAVIDNFKWSVDSTDPGTDID